MSNLFLTRLCKQDIRSLGVRNVIYCWAYAIDKIKKLPATTLKKMFHTSYCSTAAPATWGNDEPLTCHALSLMLLSCHFLIPDFFLGSFKRWGFKLLKPNGFKLLLFLLNHWVVVFYLLNNYTAVSVFLLLSHVILGYIVFHTFLSLSMNKPEQRSPSWAVLRWVLPPRRPSPWAEGGTASSEGSVLTPH